MPKETRSVSKTGGEKGVKVQAYNFISPVGLMELARLYGVGAGKYADHNFRKGYEWSKSYASLQRHANLFWSGENIDAEMGVVHMSPTAWHAFALTEFFFTFPDFDDRPSNPPKTYNDLEIGSITTRDFGIRHRDGVDRAEGEAEPRFDLIPLRPLALLAQFYGEGHAAPIGETGHLWSDDYAKLQEYANRFWWGENYNPKSGHLNTIHIIHHALSLIELSVRFPELDDRLIEGAAPIGFDSFPQH